jgi:hypothetical protein
MISAATVMPMSQPRNKAPPTLSQVSYPGSPPNCPVATIRPVQAGDATEPALLIARTKGLRWHFIIGIRALGKERAYAGMVPRRGVSHISLRRASESHMCSRQTYERNATTERSTARMPRRRLPATFSTRHSRRRANLVVTENKALRQRIEAYAIEWRNKLLGRSIQW